MHPISQINPYMYSEADILRPVSQEFLLFSRGFEKALESDQPLLKEVLQYLLLKRGKQLRPQLVLLAAQMCRNVTDKTIDTAVALEMLHTASLIHDDVVDSSAMRRGSEAIHVRWSNKVAVLTGDFILARVLQIIAQIRNARILNIVAEMSADLSSGELLQLHSNATMWINEEQYFRVIRQKTARLFSACVEAGGESSGATMRQVSALRDFGMCLGICFQMKDDILDFSDSDTIGKPTMGDIRDGKATLPLLIALRRATKDEAAHIRQLAEDLARLPLTTNGALNEAEEEIRSFVMRYDGIGYCYKLMLRYKEQAVEALSVFRDSPAKQSMLALLDYSINRLH